MTVVSSLWIGSSLSTLERACITSFLRHGHEFDLYLYDPIDGIPAGCRVLDAASILPRSRVFAHAAGEGRGSVGGFSDMFRYELLWSRGGWWVDLDVFCLSHELPALDCVIGRQGPKVINGAVLQFPAGHPFIAAAREACQAASAEWDWGQLGPDLLTRLVAQQGLHVLPPSAFYPIDWQHYWAVLDPRRSADVLRRIRGAACLHLWNEMLRRIQLDKSVLPPPGSVLRALYEATIGVDGFVQEYVLSPDCPDNAIDLRIRPFNPSRIEGPRGG